MKKPLLPKNFPKGAPLIALGSGATKEDLERAVLKAIGAPPGDRVEFISVPHAREPTAPAPTWTPTTPEDYAGLVSRPDRELREIGLRPWGDEPEGSGRMLWLFPAEWYEHIPDGTPIVAIGGCEELFVRGKSDDDRRFGLLPYGVRKDRP